MTGMPRHSPQTPRHFPAGGTQREVLRRAATERDDDFGLHQLELWDQEVRAGRGLGWKRRAVVRWTAFHHVADVDAVARRSPSRRSCGRAAVPPARRTADPAGPRESPGPRRRRPDRYPASRARRRSWSALGEVAASAAGGLVGEHLQASLRVLDASPDADARADPGCGTVRLRAGNPWAPSAFLPKQQLPSAGDDDGKLVFGFAGTRGEYRPVSLTWPSPGR